MKTPQERIRAAALLGLALAIPMIWGSCERSPKSAKGFRLPDGDVDKGKAAFVQLECHLCHVVSGVELPPPPVGPRIDVPLGGEIYRVKTYGELVSSIINPDHVVSPKYKDSLTDTEGKSIMPVFNDRMTVDQMIDLVSFLQSRYRLMAPDYSEYPYP